MPREQGNYLNKINICCLPRYGDTYSGHFSELAR